MVVCWFVSDGASCARSEGGIVQQDGQVGMEVVDNSSS